MASFIVTSKIAQLKQLMLLEQWVNLEVLFKIIKTIWKFSYKFSTTPIHLFSISGFIIAGIMVRYFYIP